MAATATVAALTTAVTAQSDRSEVDRALALLDRLDAVKLTVDLEDEPLETVVAHLVGLVPVPVEADWGALEMLSIDRRDAVTVRLRSVPASTVFASIGLQLGETIDPVFGRAVRGRGIDDAGTVVGDQRHRFARRIVGQAENDEVGVVDRLAPRPGVLAAIIGQGEDRQVGPASQPVADMVIACIMK